MNFFKKDPNYLLVRFLKKSFIFFFLVILFYKSSHQQFHFELKFLLFLPVAMILGLVSATAFHNASHGNIKPKWLNTLVGELTANLSLEDLKCFTVGHMLHHKYTDTENDPHPPGKQSFIEFILNSRNNTIRIITKFYYEYHGENEKNKLNIKMQLVVFHILALLKLILLFLLLGPIVFVFFYIPFYFSYFLGFAHLNYISHLPNENGVVEIKNNFDTIFYKIMNILTSGGYYHKNHHLYPTLYNPSNVRKKL